MFVCNKKNCEGYVALMATIIISAMLLVMSVEASIAGWHARFNILGTEAKEQSFALAQGCADLVLVTIVTDPSYLGNETRTTPTGTCRVFPLQFNNPVSGVTTVTIQANVRGSFTNIVVELDTVRTRTDLVTRAPHPKIYINAWKEVPMAH